MKAEADKAFKECDKVKKIGENKFSSCEKELLSKEESHRVKN